MGFLGPMMLSNVLQALSGTVNNIYLGQMIGTDALAASSVFFPVLFFFMALILGLGAGASVLLGQAWGAGDRERVRAIAATTVFAALVLGVVLAVCLTPFSGSIMRMLHTPPSVLPGAIAYATVMFAVMPVIFLFLLVTQLLRGIGDTTTPLWGLLLALMISLVLTPALIRGWFGLPQMGVASAAAAAGAAWFVSLLAMGVYLRVRGSALAPDGAFLRAMRPNRRLMALVLRLGLPSAAQMVTMAVAETVLLGLVNRFGADATAAYGAVNQILAYVQFPAFSIAITVTILSAQAIGAGRTARLPEILRTGMLVNLAVTGGLVLLAYALSGPVVRLFVTRGAVVAETELLLHIVLWSAVLYGAALILSGQMRSSGVVLAPTLLQIGCIVLVEVPVAWLLGARIGLSGVWCAYPAAFSAMLLVQALFFALVWRRRPVMAIR